MTINEAVERAAAIWGEERIVVVRRRPDNGFDVELTPAGIASDTRGRSYCAHRLDPNGHAVCHNDCVSLEARV